MTDSTPLIAAGGFVLLSHAVPSWPGIREALRQRLGTHGYALVHSLGSTISLGALILAYRGVDIPTHVFTPWSGAPWLVVLMMPLAFVLIALRLANPPGELGAPHPPTGIYRITRAPGALGILLWALLHLQATGDSPRVILFTTMASVAVFSIVKNHHVMTRADTASAQSFLRQTSLVPGWAILVGPRCPGRERFAVAEWFQVKPLAAITAGLTTYGVMLKAHFLIFNISPLALLN